MFYESTTVAEILLNDEKFRMLYGNYIRGLIRRRIGLSRFQGITYGLWAKGFILTLGEVRSFIRKPYIHSYVPGN